MISEHKNLIDTATWACALFAAVTINQVAAVVTLLAGIASLILFGMRVYDRLTCGSWDGPGK